jgi:hypothetical protein
VQSIAKRKECVMAVSATSFAQDIGEIPFGVDKKKAIDSLLEVVSMIEQDKILLRQVNISSKAHLEEYTSTTLVLEFVEKV